MSDKEPTPLQAGGEGGNSRDWTAKREARSHLRILEAMVYEGWQIPPETYAVIPDSLAKIAKDDLASTRDRVRAMEALAHLAQQRIDASVALDRINRLDAGTATDRPEVSMTFSDDQMRAVAESLVAKADTPKPCRKPPKRRR